MTIVRNSLNRVGMMPVSIERLKRAASNEFLILRTLVSFMPSGPGAEIFHPTFAWLTSSSEIHDRTFAILLGTL